MNDIWAGDWFKPEKKNGIKKKLYTFVKTTLSKVCKMEMEE